MVTTSAHKNLRSRFRRDGLTYCPNQSSSHKNVMSAVRFSSLSAMSAAPGAGIIETS